MQDLAAFVLHLHFLAGIAVFAKAADLGNNVIGDLILEYLWHRLFAPGNGFHLLHQLQGASCACAGYRLVGGGDHGLNGGKLCQGVDGHQGHDGGAIGIGDDALVPLHILGVDLWDHQGHIWVQTKRAGIIYEHSARCLDSRGKPLGDVVFRRA